MVAFPFLSVVTFIMVPFGRVTVTVSFGIAFPVSVSVTVTSSLVSSTVLFTTLTSTCTCLGLTFSVMLVSVLSYSGLPSYLMFSL